MEKTILTISLLCSGRDTTEKCLSSLNHLRETVSSQLIIIDTGCPENMKDVLKKYGDCVLPFTWVDDFSAARNRGIDAAEGEWFLYLDDDEWFEDTAAIEDFFLSGQYKNFDAAFYQTRDYQSFEGKEYKLTDNLRIFSLGGNSHFVGRIHEQITPARKQIKLLSSFTHHYGYAYETPEKKQAHYERNCALLKAELNEHPENVSLWAHLANEYRSAEKYELLNQTCREALAVCERSADERVWVARPTFMYGILECIYREGKDFEEGLQLCRIYEEETDLTEPAKASIYYFAALFAKELYRNEECDAYCGKYLEIYQRVSGNRELLLKQYSFFCESVFEEEAVSNINQLQQLAQLKINVQKLLDQDMKGMAEPMIQLILKLFPEDAQAQDWINKIGGTP